LCASECAGNLVLELIQSFCHFKYAVDSKDDCVPWPLNRAEAETRLMERTLRSEFLSRPQTDEDAHVTPFGFTHVISIQT